METLFQKILDLLVLTPGNLIYHLALAFSIIASLQAATIGRQSGAYPYKRRLVLGLGMLLLGQIVLFLSSGLAWQKILDSNLFLPPLDRAIMLFSLIWIVWLWNFPAPARLGDLVTGFLVLGTVILFLFTLSGWSAQSVSQSFNLSVMDKTWELASLFVVITGMAILLFSRPAGWGFGLGMLGLILAGTIAHLLLPQDGNLSGYLRLGQLAAFPLLPTLLHRFDTTPAQEKAPEKFLPAVEKPNGTISTATFPGTSERRRYSSSPRTVHAWLELIQTTEPEKILSGMSKAIAQTMLSDLCFLVSGPSYGHIVLQSGYDLIREEEMKGTMLEQSKLPMLTNGLQRSKAMRITATDSQPADIKTLGAALGLSETGSLMFIPLVIDEKPQGGILFLSPYSNRQWSTDDQNYLSSELELIARILQKAQQQGESMVSAQRIGDEMRSEVEKLRQDNRKLNEEINQLRQSTQDVQASAKTAGAQMNELNALIALQEETQDQVFALQAENERLQSALRERGISVLSPDEFKRMEADLRATLQEIALLQNELAEANARIMILERESHPPSHVIASEDHEVITSIVQEMRQPMSSILGYTDLLLAESVGILGALQRKFLERVKASTERMHSMLDDLIHVTSIGEGPVEILPQPVELGVIIDGAVADASAQLREKNIALRVDLPQELPQMYADRDAIQQIVLHLLQNAGAVTPQEGTITLRARMQVEGGKNYLLMQITDSGGGVPAEDLPRVFTRRYRADMPLIQGLGDTGVGLSIAKTLVDAHGGRIWVESTEGQSTTFSVLLSTRPKMVNVAVE